MKEFKIRKVKEKVADRFEKFCLAKKEFRDNNIKTLSEANRWL